MNWTERSEGSAQYVLSPHVQLTVNNVVGAQGVSAGLTASKEARTLVLPPHVQFTAINVVGAQGFEPRPAGIF